MGSSTKNRRRADSNERVAAVKATASRFGRAVLILGSTAAICAALFFGGRSTWTWLLTSPTFAIQRVSFVGLDRATEAELLRLSGIVSGQNLFSLDVSASERSMATHPWIQQVSVSRRFPNALSIEVKEHAPAGLLAMGELYLVNEEGHTFRRVQPGDSLDLLLVTGVDRDAYVADSAETAKRVAAAIAVGRAYAASPAGKGAALSEARLESDGVALITARGEEIRLGEGGLEEKFARLAQVRRELSARSLSAEVIHLDNRARPAWVAVKVSGSVSGRSATR